MVNGCCLCGQAGKIQQWCEIFACSSGFFVTISSSFANEVKECRGNSSKIQKMIQKQKPQKVWTYKGTEYKGAFKNFCDQEGIVTYTIQS